MTESTPEPPPPEKAEDISSSLPELQDLSNQVLGDFQLLRRIGSGGMAEVFLAEQISLKRNVAIKVLRSEMLKGSDDILLKRFEQEAKAAAALNHKNIVQVFAIGEENGIHYIAQEYVPGMNLSEYISRKGPPSIAVSVRLMRQVGSALQAAGEAGIVHRDIKPENILMTRKGEVKVADFGLAQLTLAGERVDLTQVGMTMGTPLYMSPEQVNGKPLDVRSDIYSFGVSCYHLLSGKPPFHGQTAMAVAVKHLNESAPPLAEKRPDLPKILCQIVERMMEKDPAKRYPDALALNKDLREIAKTLKQSPDQIEQLSLSEIEAINEDQSERSRVDRFFSWNWKQHLTFFLVVAIPFAGLAATAGWMLRPKDPFQTIPPPSRGSSIPKLKTAQDQFLSAQYLVNNEQAWLAVLNYFPSDRLYKNRALAQLGLIYTRQRQDEKALAMYKQLEDQPDKSSKAKGIAGRAVIAGLQNDHQGSQKTIVYELLPLKSELDLSKDLGSELSQNVFRTIRRNREVLGDEVKKGSEDLFESRPDPEEEMN